MNKTEVRERVGEMTQHWREKAQDATLKARRAARDASIAADRYVHENTWSTLGLVALCAILVGFLLGRRES